MPSPSKAPCYRSVLRSARAVEVNIAIMRTFVQLRRLMDGNRDLARKIEALEKKYDEQFSMVFEAIRQLIAEDEVRKAEPPRRIGFKPCFPSCRVSTCGGLFSKPWTGFSLPGRMPSKPMKKRQGLLMVCCAIICLQAAGCVAIPPLITVQQKEDSSSGLRSRVEELERRVQRLEERK
jgi:hypothetical protein